MTLFNYITLYITTGVACAFCFDVLYTRLQEEPATWAERILWILVWPFFVCIFLWGMFGDNE